MFGKLCRHKEKGMWYWAKEDMNVEKVLFEVFQTSVSLHKLLYQWNGVYHVTSYCLLSHFLNQIIIPYIL